MTEMSFHILLILQSANAHTSDKLHTAHFTILSAILC